MLLHQVSVSKRGPWWGFIGLLSSTLWYCHCRLLEDRCRSFNLYHCTSTTDSWCFWARCTLGNSTQWFASSWHSCHSRKVGWTLWRLHPSCQHGMVICFIVEYQWWEITEFEIWSIWKAAGWRSVGQGRNYSHFFSGGQSRHQYGTLTLQLDACWRRLRWD